MTRRLYALLLLVGGTLLALPTAPALAAPRALPARVPVAAPFLMAPSFDDGTGRAFH